MRVADAKEVARSWVDDTASALPGFRGAFLHGSINWMSDGDLLPSTSDVDVGVVFASSGTPPRLGKTRCEGILIEGASISEDRVTSAERLLGDCRLGHSFRTDGVLADPSGSLRRVQREVALHFADREWILARCEDARANCLRYVGSLDRDAPYHQQVMCWLFAEGNLTHILLSAGLRNPTVRRRYAAAGELLASVGRSDLHDALLRMLGCQGMSRSRVEHHLRRMTDVFDRAASMIRSAFPFGSDISELARPVAVDGSRFLYGDGAHREAMFWIAVTYARCMAVLAADAPGGALEEFEPGFRALTRDLGVERFADMGQRAAEIEAFLPELMALAGTLVAPPPNVRASQEVPSPGNRRN